MNCTHLPTGNGKLAGENHLGRRRAEAETRIVNDEGAQIVQNTAKREEAKQELAGMRSDSVFIHRRVQHKIMHRRQYQWSCKRKLFPIFTLLNDLDMVART